jgi:hypothetical protein
VKTSRRQRKAVNAMRAMSDVPTPARRYKYPPFFGNGRRYGRADQTASMIRRVRQRTQGYFDAIAEAERRQELARREQERREQRKVQRVVSRARGFAGRIFGRRKV